MFKKTLLIASLALATLSGTAQATPKSAHIENCGTESAKLVFKVYDHGWYYVSVTSDKEATGWYYTTPFLIKKIPVKNSFPNTFAVITDAETNTTLVANCTSGCINV